MNHGRRSREMWLRMSWQVLLLLSAVTTLDLHAMGPEVGQSWTPPAGLTQMPIWPEGTPGIPGTLQSPESTFEVRKKPGRYYLGVANVSNPTITVFPPEGTSTGASILVFPGGGFRILAMDIEGTEICEWIASIDITCVLLKYRVPGGNHYWDKDCRCHVTPEVPFALHDAQRAIRFVRAKSRKLHIAPDKIGVIGFSAGGYLVAQTSNMFEPSYAPVDAIDELSGRPDFAIALYPGHLCRSGDALDPGIHVTQMAPPTFLLQAWDDRVDKVCNSTLYARALDEAGVPAEVHLFTKGGHAFGLRNTGARISSWPSLVENWLVEIGVLGTAE